MRALVSSLAVLLAGSLACASNSKAIMPACPQEIPDYQSWLLVDADRIGHVLADDSAGSPIDRAAARAAQWIDGSRLHVEGRGFSDTKSFWNRLPARAEGVVPADVWGLSQNTAGIAVRFATDSTRIHARWSGGGAMNHMPATGVSGLDLYRRDADGRWVFAAVGRPALGETTVTLASGLARGGLAEEYLLFLPLYQGVQFLELGFDESATVRIPGPQELAAAPKPVVFYGTSITQGGCASRTGMAHVAILRRRLDREMINLGFSGSGRMEPEVGQFVAELQPDLFVFDNLPNLTDELARERIVPFVRLIRASHPTTPILLVEDFRPLEVRNGILREAFATLQAEGVPNLHYLKAGQGLIVNGENGTVDGVHPTDLGFLRMADVFEPELRRLLRP